MYRHKVNLRLSGRLVVKETNVSKLTQRQNENCWLCAGAQLDVGVLFITFGLKIAIRFELPSVYLVYF